MWSPRKEKTEAHIPKDNRKKYILFIFFLCHEDKSSQTHEKMQRSGRRPTGPTGLFLSQKHRVPLSIPRIQFLPKFSQPFPSARTLPALLPKVGRPNIPIVSFQCRATWTWFG
jgi:hypothetical protein